VLGVVFALSLQGPVQAAPPEVLINAFRWVVLGCVLCALGASACALVFLAPAGRPAR
jgi:hypothetical protein